MAAFWRAFGSRVCPQLAGMRRRMVSTPRRSTPANLCQRTRRNTLIRTVLAPAQFPNAHLRGGTAGAYVTTVPGEARVKLGMKVGCLAMVCATLAACDTKDSAQFKTALTLQRRIAEIAGQANGAAPAAVDPDTRLDGAKAGPGLRLTVMYTLVNAESKGVDSTTFESKLTPTIKEASCANPDLRPLIDHGVVVVLEYSGKKGNPIGTVNINRGTCGAVSDPRTT